VPMKRQIQYDVENAKMNQEVTERDTYGLMDKALNSTNIGV